MTCDCKINLPDQEKLRVIIFTTLPLGLRMIHEWARRHDYEIILVVTSSGGGNLRNRRSREITKRATLDYEVVAVNKVREVTPAVRSAKPDLIICFSFPYRIPNEIVGSARLGGVNLHPTPLPKYRGPNPARMIFDECSTIATTLHYIEERFDSGPILSCVERPMPQHITVHHVLNTWLQTWSEALELGIERLVIGIPAIPQDEDSATYAAPFHEEECILDWNNTRHKLQCQSTALTLNDQQIKAAIKGEIVHVQRIWEVHEDNTATLPGAIKTGGSTPIIVSALDGYLGVQLSEAR